MKGTEAVSNILLAVGAGVALLATLGLFAMRDAYQKLNFSALVVDVSSVCVALAVWLHETDKQARMKVTLIAAILFVMNAVLTHATARAIRARAYGRIRVEPGDDVEFVGERK